jgi:hypothetical protein
MQRATLLGRVCTTMQRATLLGRVCTTMQRATLLGRVCNAMQCASLVLGRVLHAMQRATLLGRGCNAMHCATLVLGRVSCYTFAMLISLGHIVCMHVSFSHGSNILTRSLFAFAWFLPRTNHHDHLAYSCCC